MPTSKPLTTITGDLPASLAQCKNKMAPHHTLPQYGCIVWRWALLGDLKKRKRRFSTQKRKTKRGGSTPVSVIPAKEFYFVFAKVSTQKNRGQREMSAPIRNAPLNPSELNSPAKERVAFVIYFEHKNEPSCQRFSSPSAAFP